MFFKKVISFFTSRDRDNNKENIVRNFLLFFGSILTISIIISIVYNQIGYLLIYAMFFLFYDKQLIFQAQSKKDFKNIILKNKYCKLLYFIHIFELMLLGIFTIMALVIKL